MFFVILFWSEINERRGEDNGVLAEDDDFGFGDLSLLCLEGEYLDDGDRLDWMEFLMDFLNSYT